MKPPCFHAVDQERGCRGFVLHVTDRASSSACSEVKTEVEPSPSAGDADVFGTYNHTHDFPSSSLC